jgi:glycosyltransferase involved in cell wall biosynthesis
MKKYLFISNSSKPTIEKWTSRDKLELSNFSKPCIEAAVSMGYEVYMGVNRMNPEELDCDYDIKFYNQNIFRDVLDIKNNYIAFKNLMMLLKKEKIDVIHCNTPIGGVMGRICGKLGKVPKIIYTAHGFHFYKGAPLINRTLFRWAEMIMAHFTDAIITINHEDYMAAQKFKLRDDGKIYYVPGVGVDTQNYRLENVDKSALRDSLGLDYKDIVLIAMGDLIPRKNYNASIRAIAKARNTKIHFLICGRGSEKVKLEELAKKLHLDNQIHFLGFRSDIKELLQIADIFLFTTFQEGLPRSMMEAMAAGLPCIASKIRGNTELIEDGKGGFLFEPTDIDGFAEAINTLSENENLRKKMGVNNLETIKNFDIENIKNEMKTIYYEILGSNQNSNCFL